MAIIGIDIGGTKIRGVLWNGKRVVRAREAPTPNNESDFRRTFVGLIASLGRQKPVAGIGVGVAGIVEKTTLLFSPNIPYLRKLDFRTLVPQPAALRADNDARAFALAEFLRGAGRGAKSMFALTIGTGVGRAYGRNGKVMRIKRFEYPEPWEKEYQATRDAKDNQRLVRFLGERLSALMRPRKPEVVVIGGGVVGRRGFLRELEIALKSRGLRAKIRRAAFRKNGAAIGAALLWN